MDGRKNKEERGREGREEGREGEREREKEGENEQKCVIFLNRYCNGKQRKEIHKQ